MQHVKPSDAEIAAKRAAAIRKLITGFVESGEEKIQTFRQAFIPYYETQKINKNLALEAKLKIDSEALLGIFDSLKDSAKKVDGSLRLRAMKVQIKALSLAFRFQFVMRDNKRGFVETEPLNRARLETLFADVNASKTWFSCEGDHDCPRDLYRLYEYTVGTTLTVDSHQLLLVLKDVCEADLTKLLVLQSLMQEKLLLLGKQKGKLPDFQAVTSHRAEFERAVTVCLPSYSESATLLGQLQLARTRVTAYRYDLVCSHLLSAGLDPRNPRLTAMWQSEISGENNIIVVYPMFHHEQTMKDFRLFAVEERRLRQSYLQPALAALNNLSMPNVYTSREYIKLFSATLREGIEQIRLLLDEMTKILTTTKVNPGDKKFLSDYCDDIKTLLEQWMAIRNKWKAFNYEVLTKWKGKKAVEVFRYYGVTVDAQIKAEIQTATKAVEEQKTEFTRLDKQAKAIADQLEAMEKDQQKRYARMREKRLAAIALQQQSPYIPPTKDSDDSTVERPAASVIVKSDALTRLEHLDAKLFKFVRRVVRNAEAIQATVTERLAVTAELSPGKKAHLQRRINGALSDFQILLRIRARFQRLLRLLPETEKLEYKEGIDASLENVAQLQAKASELLREVSETLAKVPVAEVPESKTFYPQVEALVSEEVVEENVPEYQLTVAYPPALQDIWKHVQDIPGDLSLFDDALIGLLRREYKKFPERTEKGALPVFHFAASCQTAVDVLDVNIKFHLSQFNPNQCRLKIDSPLRMINLFLTGPVDKTHIPKRMFFTCDGVMSDSNGHVEELVKGAVQNIFDGTLRTIQDPVVTLQENPEAIFIAILRMSNNYFVPTSELYNALYDWQPAPDINLDHLKAVMTEHFKQLYPDERIQYVDYLRQFQLMEKIFDNFLADRPVEEVVQGFERHLLSPPTQLSLTTNLFRLQHRGENTHATPRREGRKI